MSVSNAEGLPDYGPDRAKSRDLLGIMPDVDSIARLAMSRNVVPPLSLGIFGHPGSGKSFFAQLLRERIQDLSKRAEEDPNDRDNVHNIVQLQLNAWQSVGVSPWILLAEKIYNAMEKPVPGASKPEQILLRMPTARQISRQLDTELKGARAALDGASQERQLLSNEYRGASQHRAGLETASIWPQVEEKFSKQLDAAARNQIDQDGDRLGFPQLSQNPEILHGLLEQSKTIAGTADILTSIRVARRIFRTVLLIVLAIILAALCGFFAYYISQRVGGFTGQISTFFAGVTGVIALSGAVGVLLTGITQNQASRALKGLRLHEAQLGMVIERIKAEHQSRLSQATDELERIRTALAESDGSVAAARRSEAVANSRLNEFLLQPVGPRMIEAYHKYDPALQATPAAGLSSVATSLQLVIRADMEALSMHCAGAESGAGEGDSRAPERVIVYIDDLDLCDPLTMTAYLQAIQQLLAFPLFAVIVLADPQSLAHGLHLTDIADNASSGHDAMSSDGAEYLARLFPLHFWIKPPNMQQLSRMIHQWSLADDVASEDIVFLRQVAAVLQSPRQVKQLVSLYKLALLLAHQHYFPVDPAPEASNGPVPAKRRDVKESTALQTHLAVLVLNPMYGKQYLDIVSCADSSSTVDRLLQDLDTAGLCTPLITELFQIYENAEHSSTPVTDLQHWVPTVRRLVV